MSTDLERGFRLGPWTIRPQRGVIVGSSGEIRHLEPKVMEVLVCLAANADDTVDRAHLIDRVWNQNVGANDLLTGAISDLRRALQQEHGKQVFIETISKRGYRLVGGILPLVEQDREKSAVRRRTIWTTATAVAFLLLLLAVIRSDWLNLEVSAVNDTIPTSSLAVLPIVNITGDPGQDYFADAMTFALITELSRIDALRVMSGQSVMRFKRSIQSPAEIADELDVDVVVEGSAFLVDGRVSLSVHLIEADTGVLIWARDYERDLRNVLALHGDVARAITDEIEIALTPEDAQRLAMGKPVHPEGYRLFLLGQNHLRTWSPDTVVRGIELIKQSIELDPEFAEAYIHLARAYMISAFFGYARPLDSYDDAKNAVERALELDESAPEAHHQHAAFSFYFDWDWRAAENGFLRALERNPSAAISHQIYAWLLAALKRTEEAEARIQQSIQLDPVRIEAYLTAADVYFFSRQFDAAIEGLEFALGMSPNNPYILVRLGSNHSQLGNEVSAISALERANQFAPNNREILWTLGHAYAAFGRISLAREILATLTDPRQGRYVPDYGLAAIHAALGETEIALDLLEEAFRERDVHLVYMQVSPYLDPLRSVPRFRELLHQMNFPGEQPPSTASVDNSAANQTVVSTGDSQ